MKEPEQFQFWAEGGTLALSLDCLNQVEEGGKALPPLSCLILGFLWGWWVTLDISWFLKMPRVEGRVDLPECTGHTGAGHTVQVAREESSTADRHQMVQIAPGTKSSPDF